MRRSLSKIERLRGRSELAKVFSSSRRFSCTGARLLVVENGLPMSRVVVAPVRKIRGSVIRNRVKRLGKEAYRNIKHRVRPGHDLAFILYPGDYSYEERTKQISSLLARAGLLDGDGE